MSIPLLDLTDEIRKDLARQLIAGGIASADAPIIVDMAVHAVNECANTLTRVAGSCPLHLRIAVTNVACQLLHQVTIPHMEVALESADKWAERGRGTWHPGDEID